MEDSNLIGLVQGAFDQVNRPFRVQCGQKVSSESSCPYMAKQFEHDSETGLFFWMLSDSPWQSCEKTVPSIQSISTQDLEQSLSGAGARDIGLRPDYFSKSFHGCFDTDYKSSEQVETQKKVAVAMSYNYLNKISENTQKLSNEVLHINSLIGRELTMDLPCKDFTLPKNSFLCEEVKNRKCSPQKGLDTIASDLHEDAIAPIMAISKKIKEVRRNYSGRGGSATMIKKLRELKSAIEFIKGEYPLLQGEVLKDYIDDIVSGKSSGKDKNIFKKNLKNQLVENKRALVKKIKNHNSMSNCIIYGDSGNCDDFEEDYRDIPYYQTPYQFSSLDSNASKEERMQQLAREELYQLPECLDRSRNLKNDFNSFAAKTSLNIGLTIVTGGAALAVRAGQLGRIALSARAAALGADSAFLYKSVDESIEICNEELNKLEQTSNTSGKFQCPTKADESLHYVKKRNVSSCVTASLLSSLDALPFLPAFSGSIARAIDDPFIAKEAFKATEKEKAILRNPNFRRCIRRTKSKACKKFAKENSKTIEEMHQKCFDKNILSLNKEMCQGIEIFANNHGVYKLSDMIAESQRGKSVVVEFNSGRGHITLRYFKEVEVNGEKVMKAFSFDGPSWLFPRRINGRTLSRNKKGDSFESLDSYVPGAHYLIDIKPEQLEAIHSVAKKGGFSKACTHDARKALDEAGVLAMPKGLSKTFDKITIKKLAKDLTEKYGPPKHSTIRALEGAIDNTTAGFSKEQWSTFAVTELGWLVLTPTVIGGVYPTGGSLVAMSSIVIVDEEGRLIAFSREKYNELIEELKNI